MWAWKGASVLISAGGLVRVSEDTLDRRSGHRFVANRFDVVSVRTDDECGVVAPAVLRPTTRRTIVLAAGPQRRAIERVDLLPILRDERDMQRRGVLVRLVQAQRNLAPAELDAIRRRSLGDDHDAERLQRREEERSACRVVGDAEF